MDIDKDLSSKLDENVAKYCSEPGSSIETLCSKMRTISTCTIAVKGFLIAMAASMMAKFLPDPVYSQMFLAVAAIWYLNKYTTLKDMLMEEIVMKSYERSCKAPASEEADSKEDPKEDPKDPEDTPAPTS